MTILHFSSGENVETEKKLSGKLYLVDLAGSEKVIGSLFVLSTVSPCNLLQCAVV